MYICNISYIVTFKWNANLFRTPRTESLLQNGAKWLHPPLSEWLYVYVYECSISDSSQSSRKVCLSFTFTQVILMLFPLTAHNFPILVSLLRSTLPPPKPPSNWYTVAAILDVVVVAVAAPPIDGSSKTFIRFCARIGFSLSFSKFVIFNFSFKPNPKHSSLGYYVSQWIGWR